MEPIKISRWQARAAVVVLFLLGFAAGVLSLELDRSRWTSVAPVRLEQLSKRLNLTESQLKQTQEILNDARTQLRMVRNETQPRISEIHKATRRQLRSVLTPEQWRQLQRMMRESRARRQSSHGSGSAAE